MSCPNIYLFIVSKLFSNNNNIFFVRCDLHATASPNNTYRCEPLLAGWRNPYSAPVSVRHSRACVLWLPHSHPRRSRDTSSSVCVWQSPPLVSVLGLLKFNALHPLAGTGHNNNVDGSYPTPNTCSRTGTSLHSTTPIRSSYPILSSLRHVTHSPSRPGKTPSTPLSAVISVRISSLAPSDRS